MNGESQIRSALRRLSRAARMGSRAPLHPPPGDNPNIAYLAERMDMIDAQLKTLNRLLGGSLLTLLTDLALQLLQK